MKLQIKLLAIVALSIIGACTNLPENKKEAEQSYNIVRKNISEITKADSSFTICVQYIMRELQNPQIKTNDSMQNQITDSIKKLSLHKENLEETLLNNQIEFDTLSVYDTEINIVNCAKILCKTYHKVINEEYTDLINKMSSYKFSISEKEYVDILEISFRADSILNNEISNINIVLSEYIDKYKLTQAFSN